ncbi:Endoribonuclease L-PSP/chorismate mutase-like protein [Dactylonectria macrodidyma]|uniref:Endoribonuclease L-PSP/chorismate mutase-like protein n=1 Tax=Dactylonectria macrodidyma TaxID=307937 RepID=A0A9P9FQA4_9HYPO|nr:Endoribonuclease L-PSP/chorismate mutase-like protein [Dactylonectria macrodidyma]
MATRTAALSPNAPAPSPLMSQAVICNGMVYCSGALGLDHATGKFVEGDAAARATQALRNLDAVLQAAGTSLNKAVKITIFLSSMDHYPKLNEAYANFFTEDPKPARTCVCVAELPLGAEMEIEAVAAL